MYVPQTLHTPLSEPAWHTIGDQVEAKLKHVDAESVEELVFPTFSLYFVNKRGWSEINEDSGNKIQWNYLNLFYNNNNNNNIIIIYE